MSVFQFPDQLDDLLVMFGGFVLDKGSSRVWCAAGCHGCQGEGREGKRKEMVSDVVITKASVKMGRCVCGGKDMGIEYLQYVHMLMLGGPTTKGFSAGMD